MLSGTVPEQHVIDPLFVPRQGYRHLNTADLRKFFDYLKTLCA